MTTVSWFVGPSEDDPAKFVLSHVFVDEAARSAHFDSPAAKLIMTAGLNQPNGGPETQKKLQAMADTARAAQAMRKTEPAVTE